MTTATTQTALIEEIILLAKKHSEDDLGEVTADTPLIGRFRDGEDCEDFVMALESRHSIAKPAVPDMDAYNRRIRRTYRWYERLLTFERLKQPVVYLRDELTARQLADIVAAGAWPSEFAYPPNDA